MPSRTALATLLLALTLPLLTVPPGAASAAQHVRFPARTPVAAPSTGGMPARTLWRWPLDGTPEVLRRFSPPPAPWLAGHRGVDLAASPGEPVLAAGPGSIGFAGPVGGRGVVTVNHPGGLRTTYLPVTPAVRVGDPVTAGDPLGTLSGPTPPHCPESCLHWGLRTGTTYLDPLLLLAGARIRLLPFWPSGPLTTQPGIPPSDPPVPAENSRTARTAPTATPAQLPTTARPPLTDASPAQPGAAPSETQLPPIRRHSATTPLPHPLGLAALLSVLFLLGLLLRILRKRTRGKHSPRPPTRGQHRKQRRR